jgi:hypothetical protein
VTELCCHDDLLLLKIPYFHAKSITKATAKATCNIIRDEKSDEMRDEKSSAKDVMRQHEDESRR